MPYQKPNDITSNPPPVKIKRQINPRRMIASGLLISLMTFFATSALLLLFAFMFAPQLSNALWKTDETQIALYGTSAAVNNAQIIVDLTSTALVNQASEQQTLLDSITERDTLLQTHEAELMATDNVISTSVNATQTAAVVENALQRTQAAVNYNETQSAISHQSTLFAIEATLTQLALDTRPQPTATSEDRPFNLMTEVDYIRHPQDDCDWQGMAGMVSNILGTPTGNNILQVLILTSNGEETVTIGDNLDLGDEYNWAVQVNDSLTPSTYFVRLETIEGEPASPMIRVDFTDSCDENMAIVNFRQDTPIAN